MNRGGKSELDRKLAEIQDADRRACLQLWRDAFGQSPPKHLSRRFMKRVLAHEYQCRALGGVSAKTVRRLKQIASGKPPSTTVRAGSHLVREWNGRTYQVQATENGFVMDGQTYKSLSAVAFGITGARWSGPRFFGLR